jgi:hypothetical protein
MVSQGVKKQAQKDGIAPLPGKAVKADPCNLFMIASVLLSL